MFEDMTHWWEYACVGDHWQWLVWYTCHCCCPSHQLLVLFQSMWWSKKFIILIVRSICCLIMLFKMVQVNQLVLTLSTLGHLVRVHGWLYSYFLAVQHRMVAVALVLTRAYTVFHCVLQCCICSGCCILKSACFLVKHRSSCEFAEVFHQLPRSHKTKVRAKSLFHTQLEWHESLFRTQLEWQSNTWHTVVHKMLLLLFVVAPYTSSFKVHSSFETVCQILNSVCF